MKYFSLLLLVCLVGCASGGPNYLAVKDSLPILEATKSRLVVYRTKEFDLYWGAGAPIMIDNVKIGDATYGGFIYSDVSIGDHRISTERWDSAGRCDLDFILEKQGGVYYFEVRPRQESYDAYTGGDSVSPLIPFAGLFQVIDGLDAGSKESEGKKCGGLFSIAPVEESEAVFKLSNFSK